MAVVILLRVLVLVQLLLTTHEPACKWSSRCEVSRGMSPRTPFMGHAVGEVNASHD